MTFERIAMSQVLPKNREDYYDYKSFYEKICFNLRSYNYNQEPSKEVQKLFKDLYNLKYDKYIDIQKNFKSEFRFYRENAVVIDEIIKKEKNPVVTLNNITEMQRIRDSVISRTVSGIVSSNLDKEELLTLIKDISSDRSTEIANCQNKIQEKFFELLYTDILVDDIYELKVKKNTKITTVSKNIEKMVLNYEPSDIINDYLNSLLDSTSLQTELKKSLRKRLGNRMVALESLIESGYNQVKLKQMSKNLKKYQHLTSTGR